MKKYTRVCARINLDAIEANVEKMKNNLQDDVPMIVVVKTDAYGHGAAQVAHLVSSKSYVWGFAVATLEEAVLLQKSGITKPILILGCVFPDQREELVNDEIRMTVYTEEMAQQLSSMALSLGKKAYVHIKLDTGMGRIGFKVNENNVEIIKRISKLPGLIVEGMFTHFSKADETDKTYTNEQFEKYMWMKNRLDGEGVHFAYYHCCNSAGIIDCMQDDLNLVRAGISTYGMYPSEEVHKENVALIPALELVSHVAFVKWEDEGELISYGGTYKTNKRTKIVTIPVGYGDGYPRSLSNKGYVLIHGKKAPIIGRICMDQFMVDATDIDDVKFGDKVTLIGRDEDAFLPVETLSELSGRFNYEFVCDLGKRVPREFISKGKVIEQVDYF